MIASSTSQVSPTLRVIGPILSILQVSAMQPVLGTRPWVGRIPVAPQRLEGETIEPHVSVPMANATSPAAVADAEPAMDFERWALIERVETLCSEVGVPRRLSDLGIGAESIPDLVKSSRGSSMSGNPKELSDEELTAILEGIL